jgi:hypothetical protein
MAARGVLMVEPIGFASNPETKSDNIFQQAAAEGWRESVEASARTEFRELRDALIGRDVEVVSFAAERESSPDATFPNNWFSTHHGGRVVLYPLKAENRRQERRPEIVAYLNARYDEIIDLSSAEEEGRFLEGTGSLVIDDREQLVYASESPRTHRDLVHEWCRLFDFTPVLFKSHGRGGRTVYHTNVLLSLGSDFAVVCLEAIDPPSREDVRARLEQSGHELIDITLDQMHEFCGNVLELEDSRGDRLVVGSTRAARAFTDAQRSTIQKYADFVFVSLDTIEKHGGGSARCMLAELN